MTVEKTFCTTREAAALLGISVGTAQLWVDSGMLAGWKTPGGHRRVTRESIEKLRHLKPARPVHAALDVVSSPLQVLVVEDSSSLRRLYQIVLAQWPMSPKVQTVDNGIEAVMLIEQAQPDLLVVDLDTPGIDGFRLMGILKSHEKYAQITMVVVSGLAETDILKRGGLPPDVLVLRKPVPFPRLLAIASGIEERRKAGQGPTIA